MTPFEEKLKQLNLTYAQEELIKQAIEKYIIGENGETKDLMNQSLGMVEVMNMLRDDQRKLLRGEE